VCIGGVRLVKQRIRLLPLAQVQGHAVDFLQTGVARKRTSVLGQQAYSPEAQ